MYFSAAPLSNKQQQQQLFSNMAYSPSGTQSSPQLASKQSASLKEIVEVTEPLNFLGYEAGSTLVSIPNAATNNSSHRNILGINHQSSSDIDEEEELEDNLSSDEDDDDEQVIVEAIACNEDDDGYNNNKNNQNKKKNASKKKGNNQQPGISPSINNDNLC
jgi:hypothetical protein